MAKYAKFAEPREIENAAHVSKSMEALALLDRSSHPCMVIIFNADATGVGYMASKGLTLLSPEERRCCLQALAAYLSSPYE